MNKIMLPVFLVVCTFAVNCSGQSLSGERVLLDASFPYIRLTRTNDSSHFIDCLSDQTAFLLNGGYKFRIFENAQDNALVVNSSGIGITDSGAGTQISITQSDTAQTFGITSLSSNNGFYNGGIGFKTNSYSFPFYVFDTARDESLSVRQEGVGVGTYDAMQPLHVYADGNPYAQAKVLVENNLPTTAIREMFELVNNGGTQFSFTDTNLLSKWTFASDSIGRFAVTINGTGGPEITVRPNGQVTMGPGGVKNFDLRTNGNLHILGTLFQSSDKNLKTAFEDVDPASVLDKLAAMPITTWQFKSDDPELRHIGPTAQDFRSAFELGYDEKTIAPIDGIGVALASIQALNQKVEQKCQSIETSAEQKDQLIEKLSAELETQQQVVSEQGQLIEELAARLEAMESRNN